MSKVKYSVKLKQEVADYFLNGHSCNLAVFVFEVCKSSVSKWIKLYNQNGADGLK